MPITIDYGPISTAMGLASQAGAVQGQRADFGEDMNLLNYAQRAQQLANQQRATEISQALSGNEQGIQQQHNTAQLALANAQLSGLNAYRQGRNDIGQQNAGSREQQVQNQGDYQQGRLDISQQNANTGQTYKTGMLGLGQQNADTRTQAMGNQNVNAQAANQTKAEQADTEALHNEAQGLQQVIAAHDKNFQDPKDPQYLAAVARLQAIHSALAQRNANLNQPIQHTAQQGARTSQPPQQAQPGSTPSNPVQVHSTQDYANLTPGTYYIDSTGALAQKR